MGLFSGLLGIAGGILGKSSDKKERIRQEIRNDPRTQRKIFEEAGLNPLLQFGTNVGKAVATAPAPRFGSLIHDAIAGAAQEKTEQQKIELEKTRLEILEKEVDDKIKKNKLRPKVASNYQLQKYQGPLGPNGTPQENATVGQPQPEQKEGNKNKIPNYLGNFFTNLPFPTVSDAADDGELPRFVEHLENVGKTASSGDFVHGRLGPFVYLTVSEEAAEIVEPFDGILRSGVAALSIPPHMVRTSILNRKKIIESGGVEKAFKARAKKEKQRLENQRKFRKQFELN